MIKDEYAEIDAIENGDGSNKIIELRAVFKNGKTTVQPAWDPKTNWWAGVERLSDEDKRGLSHYVTVGDESAWGKNNTKLVLTDGLEFDLNNPVDKVTWAWVKRLPMVAMSYEKAQSSKAQFFVHIEGREAEVSNSHSDNMFAAMKYIMEDPTTNYINRALLLGMDMENEPTSVVKQYLMSVAKKTPAKILEVYRSRTMRMDLLFVSAKRLDIIHTDRDSGCIMYGRQTLGTTEKSAKAFLRENSDLVDLLERDVKPEYFSGKADTTPTDIVNNELSEKASYPYMKKKAKELGYDGGLKQPEVIAFLEGEGIDIVALGVEERTIAAE